MSAFCKRIWDPRGKMTPGKLIDAYRVDENLRLGPDYNSARPATHFAFITPEGRGFTGALEPLHIAEVARLAIAR